MIRVLISIFLSILIHIYFLSYIRINNNNNKEKESKKTSIIYVKNKKNNPKTIKIKEVPKIPKLPKIKNKIIKETPKKIEKIIKNNKTVNNAKVKNNEIKKAEKVEELSKEEIELYKKIEVLRKNPYFKNWSDERIKKLELPPGMKTWEEVEKMTNYLDTEYNWTSAPPNLGEDNKSYWKEFYINDKTQIRFLFEETIFIAEFQEDRGIIFITYFTKTNDTNKDFDIPENIKDDNINFFQIELTEKLDTKDKNKIIINYIEEIINYYKSLKQEQRMN